MNGRIIPFAQPEITEEDRKAVLDVLDGPILTHGPQGKAFEKEFGAFIGEDAHCVAVSSCMAALHLSYVALGIGPGDEVIVPAQTHVATVHAVEWVGATPVFVDCDPLTGNVTPEGIEAAITPRTRAIGVVHFLGIPCDMPSIMVLAEKHNLQVVEDCALALGARFDGKHVGLFGDAACFSFYPAKHITTGEGGMFVSRHARLAETVSRLRGFGVDRTHTERSIPGFYDVTALGTNYRMSELHAALGRAQLRRMARNLDKRRDHFSLLKQAVSEHPDIRIIDSDNPRITSGAYCLSLVLETHPAKIRIRTIEELNRSGIGTSIYYPHPVPRLAYYRHKYGYEESRFPCATRISDNSIALPVGPHLTDHDVDTLIRSVRKVLRRLPGPRAAGNRVGGAVVRLKANGQQEISERTSTSLSDGVEPLRALAPRRDLLQFSGRKIILVGGAGFIGHHLALALAAQGAQVHVVDSLQINNLLSFASGNGNGDMHHRNLYLNIIHQRLDLLHEAGISLHVQDARDYHALVHIFNQVRPEVVIHLAAVAHANRSNKDPYSTFDHSLRTLENSLDCSRGSSVRRFIFLSSSMVYGDFSTRAVNEEHLLNPIGIYGALKLAGEKMVIAYRQVFDLPYTVIRPSALYGPRCVSRRVGQIFIESALAGSKLRVAGDGAEQIDFTYVDDLVHGIVRAIQYPAARNETFNMTCGHARSIRELLDVIVRYFPDATVEHAERDPLTPVRGTLDISKARRLLGYSPQFSIEEGFGRYIQWYREIMEKGNGHHPPMEIQPLRADVEPGISLPS